MKLQPIEDHVLIKPINEENTTKSGIILPDSKEKPRKWEVIAVGDGRILDDGSRSAMDVKEWDIVYFTQYAPDEIEYEGFSSLYGSVLYLLYLIKRIKPSKVSAELCSLLKIFVLAQLS